MTRYAKNLKTGKVEKLTSTGMKDEWNKVIWIDENGNRVELEQTRHFNKTNYYFHPQSRANEN